MIKNLTTLRWKKCIYYTSDNVIFDIRTSERKVDLDECSTYLIDINNAPDFVKNAPNGAVLDLSSCPEIFNKNVVYINLRFINMETSEYIDKFYPLLSFIEEGDKIINGVVHLNHPEVYDDLDIHNTGLDNRYANKFNNEVVNYIKSLVVDKQPFELNTLDMVMKSLPAWLTSLFDDGLFMTENYINNFFAKGYLYNRKEAIKNASNENPLLRFVDSRIGVGIEAKTPAEEDGWYVPINLWQKDVVYNLLKAISAEKIINKYNNESHNVDKMKYLSKDSKEQIAEVIKYAETLPSKSDDIKTFINTNYMHHDCYDIKFESKCTTVDTYWEWLSKKSLIPTINVEDTINEDIFYIRLQYNAKSIDEYIGNEEPNIIFKFYESCISLYEYLDSDDSEGKVSSVSNVFQVMTKSQNSWNTLVVLITHTINNKEIVEINDFWIEDFDLMLDKISYPEPSGQGSVPVKLVKTYLDAFNKLSNASNTLPHSRQCVLRHLVGPNQISPQYVFGNNTYALYVDALNLNIKTTNPAFEGYDPFNNTLLNNEITEYLKSHMYSKYIWVNNEYVLNNKFYIMNN